MYCSATGFTQTSDSAEVTLSCARNVGIMPMTMEEYLDILESPDPKVAFHKHADFLSPGYGDPFEEGKDLLVLLHDTAVEPAYHLVKRLDPAIFGGSVREYRVDQSVSEAGVPCFIISQE